MSEVVAKKERGEMARATKGRRWGRREKGLRNGIREYAYESRVVSFSLIYYLSRLRGEG